MSTPRRKIFISHYKGDRIEVDNFIKRFGHLFIPNGLMGIVLPSQNNRCRLPPRFRENWDQNHENCYAKFWSYPDSGQQLGLD